MFYTDTTDQLVFLITVCFSFFMLVSSFWFKNADHLSRLLGIVFLVPALCYAASLMTGAKPVFYALTGLAEPAMLLVVFILLVARPGKYFGETVFLISVYTFALIIASYKLPALRSFMAEPQNRLFLLIIPMILNLYLLKKENGAKAFLFWALLPLVAGSAADCYISHGYLSYLAPLLKLTAYILFNTYFYREYFHEMLRKTEEARNKIIKVNRNLDLEVKKRMMEMERINENLVNLSKTDSLSKAMNKAAILDAMENLIQTKQKSEFSILMFDIDNFKQINDTYGHVTGDKCIRSLSVTAKSNLRDFDLIGRYGGDEFIIILPGTGIHHALQIAERYRKTVEKTETPHYTVSIGAASYPRDGSTVKALLEAADEGLYKSKSRGRNIVSYREYP